MLTQDIIAIVLGLSLSGMWLIYKLDRFQWVPKVNDPKGIVFPSFIFLLSPFLAIWIMPTFTRGDIGEIIKPIVPLTTFILGQVITKVEKQKENEQQKRDLAKMIISNLAPNIYLLTKIERKLINSCRNPENQKIIEDIEKLIEEKFKVEMEKLYESLNFQLGVIRMSSAMRTLVYISTIKNDVVERIKFALSSENKLDILVDIRLHIMEGYENIIALTKEPVPDDELNNYFDRYINELKQERERLIKLKERINSKQESWKVKLDSEWQNNPNIKNDPDIELIKLHNDYDIDPECEAILKIESLLEHFNIPFPFFKLCKPGKDLISST